MKCVHTYMRMHRFLEKIKIKESPTWKRLINRLMNFGFYLLILGKEMIYLRYVGYNPRDKKCERCHRL